MRGGRKPWEAAYMTKTVRRKPDVVNDVWFGDHHQFDLFVVDERGRAVRPWLTAWYDIGSGALVGWCISTNPNSETIREAFVRAVAEKPGSPIYGAPNAIYIDNGKDYRSRAFEGDADADFWRDRDPRYDGRDVPTDGGRKYIAGDARQGGACAGVPRLGKAVERYFRTLEERYCRQLIGYCGGKPADRAENFERMLRGWMARGELMTIDEFVDVFQGQILPAYNAHPHEGYGGETPEARYAPVA